MICFHPDGRVLAKVNMCSCSNCLEGCFMSCSIEKGVIVNLEGSEEVDDMGSDVEYEQEQEEFGDDVEDDLERYEMRSSTVIEAIQKFCDRFVFSAKLTGALLLV